MSTEKKEIAELLSIPEEKVRIDRYRYTSDFPNEIKAWRFIGKKDPQLREYKHRFFYPASDLILLIDLATELLVRKRYPSLEGLPGLVGSDTRFRKPVLPETELLIQVKLLRNYKGRIGIFTGVIADGKGDIVAENISKGTIIVI
jgi:3-hydroxymyristoyl/3-hydroxydecanoyl-(acyl carrier protein) dehydratase